MEPSIRLGVDAPDSAELRYYLRHAGSLLAASDVASPERAAVLRRARAWVAAALAGIDEHLCGIDRAPVPDAITDAATEAHDIPDEILLPPLRRIRRPE